MAGIKGHKVPGCFQPGKSGNPGGRPTIPVEVKEAARAYTMDAIATLAKVMNDEEAPPSARITASEALLNRAWGKAESTVTVKDVRDVRDLSRAEILAALAAFGVTGSELSAEQPNGVH